jgi:hypothetical protein
MKILAGLKERDVKEWPAWWSSEWCWQRCENIAEKREINRGFRQRVEFGIAIERTSQISYLSISYANWGKWSVADHERNRRRDKAERFLECHINYRCFDILKFTPSPPHLEIWNWTVATILDKLRERWS